MARAATGEGAKLLRIQSTTSTHVTAHRIGVKWVQRTSDECAGLGVWREEAIDSLTTTYTSSSSSSSGRGAAAARPASGRRTPLRKSRPHAKHGGQHAVVMIRARSRGVVFRNCRDLLLIVNYDFNQSVTIFRALSPFRKLRLFGRKSARRAKSGKITADCPESSARRKLARLVNPI